MSNIITARRTLLIKFNYGTWIVAETVSLWYLENDRSMYVESIWTVWGQKHCKRKISNIHEDFGQYQVAMHTFLSQSVSKCPKRVKMSQYSHYTYCLQNELTHFGLILLIYFSLEVLGQFWSKKPCKKT